MTDAWKQQDDLLRRFTKEWKVRADLRVTAHATERGVELEVGELREDYRGSLDIRGRFIWHSTDKRNVSTMRELANTLLAACDFVDESNPKWASHGCNLDTPDSFLVEDD